MLSIETNPVSISVRPYAWEYNTVHQHVVWGYIHHTNWFVLYLWSLVDGGYISIGFSLKDVFVFVSNMWISMQLCVAAYLTFYIQIITTAL